MFRRVVGGEVSVDASGGTCSEVSKEGKSLSTLEVERGWTLLCKCVTVGASVFVCV